MKDRCHKCGYRLILIWVGGHIPWLACPSCDHDELTAKEGEKHD